MFMLGAGIGPAEGCMEQTHTNFTDKIKETIERLNPKFDELAEGYAEFLSFDESKGAVTVKLIGGKLL
jgi:hypothetical protein